MVGEYNGNGSVAGRYIRGINLIANELDGQRQYYLYNAHGDVVQRTDGKGVLLKRYEYDAFGNEREAEEKDGNPWRYCGEYWDAGSGTYYLRARYYEPKIGRFLSEDKIREQTMRLPNEHKIVVPMSLNFYTYCYNNPIKYTDPSGNKVDQNKLVQNFMKQYYQQYTDYIEGA